MNSSVIVGATSFAVTSPYLQSEWLLDCIGRPLQDGISFASSSASSCNSLAPRWATDGLPAASGAEAKSHGNGRYVSAQTSVAYTFASYRLVLFVDLDDSMLSVLPDGSVSFDALANHLSALLEDTRVKCADRGLGVQLAICAQHIDTGFIKTVYEGLLVTYAKSVSPAQIKKLLFRHLHQPGGGPRRQESAISMEFALEYCKAHTQLMDAGACPVILYVTSGLRTVDIAASTALLSAIRAPLHVLFVSSTCYRILDVASLEHISRSTGGVMFDTGCDAGMMSEQLLRPLYYKPSPAESRRENPNRVQLCAYELEGLMFQHIIALRLLDGFHLIGAFSEAGRYLDSSSSDRRLAYKYTFRFEQKLSKLTSLIYEASCLIFQKTAPTNTRRQRSARTSFRASRGQFTPSTIKIFSAPLPSEWSAATRSAHSEKLATVASKIEKDDVKLALSIFKITKLFDGRISGTHRRSLSDQQGGGAIADMRKFQLSAHNESFSASDRTGNVFSDLTVRLIPLSSAMEQVGSLDTLCSIDFYVRGVELLTDLSRNNKFHDLVVTNILSCFGSDCSCHEYAIFKWLLVGPSKASTEAGSSSTNSARACPDMMLVSITHNNGVFMRVTMHRFRVGPPRKTYYFNKEPGYRGIPDAVSGALEVLGFCATALRRDLSALFSLSLPSMSAVRIGKLMNRSIEYAIDLSDPLTFSSIVNEISASKLQAGFQVCKNYSESGTGTVVMNFCAVVSTLLCDVPVETLLQCHVICRVNCVVIQHFWEQEFPQYMFQKSGKKLGSLVLLLTEQDDRIVKLYSVLICIFKQYRQQNIKKTVSSGLNGGLQLRLSLNQWDFLAENSDPVECLLPSFMFSDIQTVNSKLADLLSSSLVENDNYVNVNISNASSDVLPTIICKHVDAESLLVIDLVPVQASGTIEISDPSSVAGDSFVETFESCLTAHFRLFKLPLLRSFVKSELQAMAQLFGMMGESSRLGAENNTSESTSDLDLYGKESAPTVEAAPPLNPPLLRKSSSARIAKLFQVVRDSIFNFHLRNYAVVLYTKIRNYNYVPSPHELSTALFKCRVVTHELDISTMCIAKRSALRVSGRARTMHATIEAFRVTVGGTITPIPESDYFIYTPKSDIPVVPLYIKFDYVLLTQPVAIPPTGLLEEEQGTDNHILIDDSAELSEEKSIEDDKETVTSPTEADIEAGNDAGAIDPPTDVIMAATPNIPEFASDELIAQCLVNLSEGLSPQGEVVGDASDYIMRVEFYLPQCRSERTSFYTGATLDSVLKRRTNMNFGAFRDSHTHENESIGGGERPLLDAGELTRTSYLDFSAATSILAAELDTFIALDVLESLAVVDSPTPETLVLAQHCLNMVPGVLKKSVALDVVSPSSLSSRNLPDVATNKILNFLDKEIRSCLQASKIGDVYYIRRWRASEHEGDNAKTEKDICTDQLEDGVNSWILLSPVNAVISRPENCPEKLTITTIELSITFRLLDNSAELNAKQTSAIDHLISSLATVSKRVNQRTLLYDLLQTHTASSYLLQDAVAEQPDDAPVPRSTGRHRPPVPTNEMRYAKPPKGLIAEKEKARLEKEKMKAQSNAEPVDTEAPAVISAMSHSSFTKGTFSCPVQGSVNCAIHSMQNFNIDIAIRQLEKLAFDPFVILNAKSRFVYSKDGAIYYMAFNQQKRDEKLVQLDVYGVSPMASDMKDQLQNLLESKLAEYTSGLISEEIAAFKASAKFHLRSADINFLKERGKPRSVALSATLPSYVGDPLFYVSLARQLLLATPNVQSSRELLGIAEKKKGSKLSSVYHPACFGHNILDKLSKPTASASAPPSPLKKDVDSDGESMKPLRPMLQRKKRVEMEVNDPTHINPVFFHRPMAEQLPRADIRFHESSSLWDQENFRFVYSYTGGRTTRGDLARGETKQFGVGLAVIELSLCDSSQKSSLQLFKTGSKATLLDDISTLHQKLKSGGQIELEYHQTEDLGGAGVNPSAPPQVLPPRTPSTKLLYGSKKGAVTAEESEQLLLSPCKSPDNPTTGTCTAANSSQYELVLTITPTSDINTNILMKYCRKCLDDALISYCGERFLSSGQQNSGKSVMPTSIHPKLHRYDDLLRSLHDLLFTQHTEQHVKTDGPVLPTAVPVNGFGCLTGALTLSRASALVLQQSLLDCIFTACPQLKDTVVACNCSPLFSATQNVGIMKRTTAGAAPKWACLKKNRKGGVFHSSVVVGNMFPSHSLGPASSDPVPPGNIPQTHSGSVSNLPAMGPTTHSPSLRSSGHIQGPAGLQSQSSLVPVTDGAPSLATLQLMNDDTFSSSDNCTAPMWLRRRRSLIDVSINTEGWFIFYFNINPRFILKLQSCITTFTTKSMEMAKSFGTSELERFGILDDYMDDNNTRNRIRGEEDLAAAPTPLAGKSVMSPLGGVSLCLFSKVVTEKVKLVLSTFQRYSWGRRAISKLFIPHSDSKHGDTFDSCTKAVDGEGSESFDKWRLGMVDFCQEFPLPVFGKTKVRNSSQLDNISLGAEECVPYHCSFDVYAQSILSFVRDDKFGNFDVRGSASAGVVFIITAIPCQYGPSHSSDILSVTEICHGSGDIVRIVHRLCFAAAILVSEVTAALSTVSEFSTVQLEKFLQQLKSQCGVEEFAWNVDVTSNLLEVREYRLLKVLHQRLYLEIVGCLYRRDMSSINSLDLTNPEESHRSLDVVRSVEHKLRQIVSIADIYIPLSSVLPRHHTANPAEKQSEIDNVVYSILRVLELGPYDEANVVDSDLGRISGRVIHYRMTSNEGSSESNALLGYNSRGNNGLWQSERPNIEIVESSQGGHFFPSCGEFCAMGTNRRDPYSVVQYNIAGNVLLSFDSSKQRFSLKTIMYNEQDIASYSSLNFSASRHAATRFSKSHFGEERDGSDANTQFAKELESRTIRVKAFRSRSQYYENVAAVTLAKLKLAYEAVLLRQTWHHFTSGNLGTRNSSGNTQMIVSSVELLISKSHIQRLPFLDFLKEPLRVFLAPGNFKLLLNYMLIIFGRCCVATKDPDTGTTKLLICNPPGGGSNAPSLHFAVVLTLSEECSDKDSGCSVYVIRSLGMDSRNTDSEPLEDLVNKVVDIILSTLVDTSTPEYY